jgi:hypothetical protein
MAIDTGRSPSGRATRPADQAPAGLGDTASVPNALSSYFRRLTCCAYGHVSGGIYLGYDAEEDVMRRSCLRCGRPFLDRANG